MQSIANNYLSLPYQFVIVVIENENKRKEFDRTYFSPKHNLKHAKKLVSALNNTGCKAVLVKLQTADVMPYDIFSVFLAYALAYGVSNELARLGAACFRRAYHHDSDGWLLKKYGWSNNTMALIDLALENPKGAKQRWTQTICHCPYSLYRSPFDL